MYVFYSKNVSWVVLSDYVFVFDEITNTIYSLADISKDFWLLIQNNEVLLDVIQELTERYDVEYDIIKSDIVEFTEVLVKNNLLIWGDVV